MEEQAAKKPLNKNLVIGGIVLAVVVMLIAGMTLMGGTKKNVPTQTQQTEEEEELIPTVDASVQVELEALEGKKEVNIKVDGVPNGTEGIDYELSYETVEQGLQGAIGSITVESGAKSVEEKVTLGTCSSGSCVYHKIQGPIKASLKFTGSYGERLFEKEFDL